MNGVHTHANIPRFGAFGAYGQEGGAADIVKNVAGAAGGGGVDPISAVANAVGSLFKLTGDIVGKTIIPRDSLESLYKRLARKQGQYLSAGTAAKRQQVLTEIMGIESQIKAGETAAGIRPGAGVQSQAPAGLPVAVTLTVGTVVILMFGGAAYLLIRGKRTRKRRK